MNDYCLNQSQGLKAQQHTSTYNKYPANYPSVPSPPTPTLPIHLYLDIFLINQKKGMKHEHKLQFTFVPGY